MGINIINNVTFVLNKKYKYAITPKITDSKSAHANLKKIADHNQNGFPTLREAASKEWEQIIKCIQKNKSRLGDLAMEFSRLVELNLTKQHSVMFYASQLYITKSYLRKICQQVIGKSPTHCIQTRLMLEACIRLNASNVTVKEIALGLGFDDYSYFSRFFKKRGGLPPDAYRKIALKRI